MQGPKEAVKEVEISIKKNINIDFSLYEFNIDTSITKTDKDGYIKYTSKNLTRYSPNGSSVSSNYYLPHIIITVNTVSTTENLTNILKTTSDQYNWYNSLIKELDTDDYFFRKLSASILKDSLSDKEKINGIFKWVQNNIQYLAFENGIAGFKPSEAKDVATSKYGDCKGMANLLVTLLRINGFDANHAWLGTRQNNYSYSTPSLVVDNHMICALQYNNAGYFLDATSKSAVWDIPPPHLEGKEVLIANGNSYLIDTIVISKPTDNIISIIGSMELIGKKPKVNYTIQLKGHFMRNYISYTKHMSIQEKENIPFYFIKRYLDGVKIEAISEPVITNESISYVVEGSYLHFAKGKNSIVLFPFFNLTKNLYLKENAPPIYIDFPYKVNILSKIKESSLPIKESLFTSNIVGSENYNSSYSIIQNGNNIDVNQTLYINTLNTTRLIQTKWNDFILQTNIFNTYPIVYDFDD